MRKIGAALQISEMKSLISSIEETIQHDSQPEPLHSMAQRKYCKVSVLATMMRNIMLVTEKNDIDVLLVTRCALEEHSIYSSNRDDIEKFIQVL